MSPPIAEVDDVLEPDQTPAPVDSWAGFPISLWTPWVREYVRHVAHAASLDPVYAAIYAIGLISGAVGCRRWARAANGHTEPGIVWHLGFAEQGAGKSVLWRNEFDRVAGEIRSALRMNGYETVKRDHSERLARFRRDLKKFEKGETETPPDDPGPPPVLPVVCLTATNIEGARDAMAGAPNGFAIISDEIGALLCGQGEHKGGRANAISAEQAIWCKAHDGSSVVIGRAGRQIHIERFAASLCGWVQPKKLQRFLASREAGVGFLEDGMASRFHFWSPPRALRKYSDARSDERHRERFRDRILAIHRLGEFDAGSRPEIPLCYEADEVFREWCDSSFREAFDAAGSELKPWLDKATGIALRYALLFHITDALEDGSSILLGGAGLSDPTPISEEAMRRGIAMTQRGVESTARSLALLRIPEDRQRQARLLAYLLQQGKKSVTAREIRQRMRFYREQPDFLDPDLQALVDREDVRAIDSPEGVPGRPTIRYLALRDPEA